ncbi:MAG: hypothetical protein BWX88_00305 [Planctomycetes bacterium ADurb.Bin126]|nr:MAG: hypothetical protein BWX88_00305 [Planctomycetes bacterium ADurb.Bin126]
MRDRPARDGKLWTRDELVIVFELYCRTPFQKTKANNPEVGQTARLLRRTPGSVARKLGNFGAFDPQLKRMGITGLVHVGHLDRAVWDEFHHDWNSLVIQAHNLREALGERKNEPDTIVLPTGASERLQIKRARIYQSFFRQAVLSSYEGRCCVTGIGIQECLTASHIVPWSHNESLRTDPTNGLCLSATFDRLFDAGLITIMPELTIELSSRLLCSQDRPILTHIACYHRKSIARPSRFLPAQDSLAWHRRNVFQA